MVWCQLFCLFLNIYNSVLVNNIPVEYDNSLPVQEIKYYLYTRNNPLLPELIVYHDLETLNKLDKTKETKVLIHGWISNYTHDLNILITDAFLSKMDVNVIVVDWGKDASKSYYDSAKMVPSVGRVLSSFFNWLVFNEVPLNSLHIIGFSMGAHIAGIATRNMIYKPIKYLTALDPADKNFVYSSERIGTDVAEYVEVIHTSTIGLINPVGHNDFYPNAGSCCLMPGCSTVECSHHRAFEYFADSLDHKGFMAQKCATIDDVYKGNCNGLGTIYMGGSKPKSVLGLLYLTTNAQKPYYQGIV